MFIRCALTFLRKVFIFIYKKKLINLFNEKMFINKITFTKKLYNVNYLNKTNNY